MTTETCTVARCRHCKATLGPSNRSGFCRECARVNCYVCAMPLLKPGCCRECKRVLRLIHEAHAGECGERHTDHDERMKRYTELAKQERPLFEGRKCS